MRQICGDCSTHLWGFCDNRVGETPRRLNFNFVLGRRKQWALAHTYSQTSVHGKKHAAFAKIKAKQGHAYWPKRTRCSQRNTHIMRIQPCGLAHVVSYTCPYLAGTTNPSMIKQERPQDLISGSGTYPLSLVYFSNFNMARMSTA